MPTINQLIRHGRRGRAREDRVAGSQVCPQKRGVCVRVYTTTPKKPNSALRKVCRVRLTNGMEVTSLHPGRRPQPPGALGRAHPRRPREGPPGRSLPRRPRHARRVGRHRPVVDQQGEPQPQALQVRRQAPEGQIKQTRETPMPRRREVPKRKIIPDPKFKDKLVAKFTNTLMFDGKKADGRGHPLRRVRRHPGALQGGPARGLPQGARQRQAEARSEEPPRRWCDLPGPGRSSPRAPRRARDALARQLLPRPRREDDARAPRRRVRRRGAAAAATPSRRRTTRTRWPRPTRRSPTTAGDASAAMASLHPSDSCRLTEDVLTTQMTTDRHKDRVTRSSHDRASRSTANSRVGTRQLPRTPLSTRSGLPKWRRRRARRGFRVSSAYAPTAPRAPPNRRPAEN